ncbi:MAG: TadE/TadG family type IV pilus assembly protein [Candidatus Dormibacteria bacterium]
MRTSLIPRHRAQESGQAVVEFALFLPIILLLLFGAVNVSILFNNITSQDGAVRDSARYASINPASFSTHTPPDANSIQGIAYAENTSLTPDAITINYYYPDGGLCGTYTAGDGFVGDQTDCTQPGYFVQVVGKVIYTPAIINVFSGFGSGGLPISTSYEFVIQ